MTELQADKLVTQMDYARAGQITPQMKEVAEREHRDPEYIRERVADGRIAIPANIVHIKKGMRAFGVGEGLSTKVNVNLGISGDKADAAEEWKKVKIAEDLGADAIMDLSNSGKTRKFRQQLIDETPLMVGTVPMYDAIGYMEKPLVKLTKDDLLATVRAHAEDGVDFVTIHAGINRSVIKTFKETGRLMNIVSRGGSLLFGWMEVTGNENPFYEFYDEVLDICHEYDVTISLGDSCRPGCLYDANDATETAEIIELGKLAVRAWKRGVQVMIEGPGHMAIDEIAANMKMEKRLCHNAPFYVLGPLVTDIGVNMLKQADFRLLVRRNMQAASSHERQQTEGFERNRLAAGVRAGDDEGVVIIADGDVDRHGLVLIEQRMARAKQLAAAAVLNKHRCTGIHVERQLGTRKDEVQRGQRIVVLLDGALVHGHAR